MGGSYIFAIDGHGQRGPEGSVASGAMPVVVEQNGDGRAVGQVEFTRWLRNKVFQDTEDKDAYTHALLRILIR